MWKKIINFVAKNVKKNETLCPVRRAFPRRQPAYRLRPVEQYEQLSLPLD
ncbi:MAG: hypothetical protein IJW07_02045 [Lentisphaeria bacterium]|nr:hypothetical protein [Lentisphaeria bacterium]MBR2000231.1 hypothetical protein [Lentisphaeria bacterium]MBR3707920.1 hypothetical protein [Lentisphaeria bacterium]MBR4075370.1 hypothetical protein [Lentisphaeria bacterium]